MAHEQNSSRRAAARLRQVRDGNGVVQFGRMPDGLLKLVVTDNGKGITPRVEFSNTVGLGMHIVALMVQLLRASLSIAHVHGSCFKLRFPENDSRQGHPTDRPPSVCRIGGME